MLIKTIVDSTYEGAKRYKSHCRQAGSETFEDIELHIAEIEYADGLADEISREIAQYYVHTVFTFDYESSSDAGDGRDDYYQEEEDLQISVNTCIIKDDHFFGVMCESFDTQCFLLLDHPETVIHHPGNYGGRNYHFYRNKRFKLIQK